MFYLVLGFGFFVVILEVLILRVPIIKRQMLLILEIIKDATLALRSENDSDRKKQEVAFRCAKAILVRGMVLNLNLFIISVPISIAFICVDDDTLEFVISSVGSISLILISIVYLKFRKIIID